MTRGQISAQFEDQVVDRNIRGMALEKAWRHDEAATLYEINISVGDVGSHPYNRLRLYYQRAGRPADVLRVCQAYIDLPGMDPQLIEKFRRWMAKAQRELSLCDLT